MNADFSQPQRQSPIGILIMFFDTVQQFARALWPILVVWVLKLDEVNKLWIFLGTVAVFISIGIVAYLKYRNFTFFLDATNEEFVINEGVFNKTKTAIQLDKIQQVNVNQSLVQRIIGVYALEVDTAGSTKKEAKIKAVSHELALALKARLLENEKKKEAFSDTILDEVTMPVLEEKPFIKISFLSLLKVGITSNYVRSIGLLAAFFVTIYENVRRFSESADFDEEKFDQYFNKELLLQSFFSLVFLLLFVILAINVVRVIFRYFNFEIKRQNGSLLLSFGLVNTKSTIIKPEKVQITTITQNYFQKKMNILEMKIKQATSGEKEERKSAIDIPGCNDRERDAIFKLLFQKIPQEGIVLKPNYRKLVFSVFLSIAVPLTGFFAFTNAVAPQLLDFVSFVPVYVIFVGLILGFSFRNNRLFITENFIIKQSGAWDIDKAIIQPEKIQAITTSQLFWHKKADIGSIIIHTAGGNVAFQLGNFTKIKHYVNLWLYEIETSDSNWM